MTFFLYLLLSSASLGYNAGVGVGAAAEYAFGITEIHVEADWLAQTKRDRQGWFAHALAEARFGTNIFGLVGAAYGHTQTDLWSKSGFRPVIGAGYRRGRSRTTVRYLGDDGTVNETTGVQLQWERLGKVYIRATAGHYWFDNTEGSAVNLGVGWRW